MEQAEAVHSTAGALSLSDLNTTINHEPRISHVRLAEVLGYQQPHKLAHLIGRHSEALERFGPVPSTVDGTRSPLGGRARKLLWPNKKQALYLCTKSDTPRATEVTIQMVEVFDAYTEGKLAPPSLTVREHKRRLPKPVPAKLPSLPDLATGFGCIVIDGRTVLFDTTQWDLPVGTEIVGIFGGGIVVAALVEGCSDGERREGRLGMVPLPPAQYAAFRMTAGMNPKVHVRIIGRVIGRL